MTVDVIDLIALSPRRWRYPELAAALAGGKRPALDAAVTLVLGGTVRPRGLAESVTAIIADGRYATAEELLLEILENPGTLDEEALERLDADLELSRATAVADAERAWADLNARAAEIGLPVLAGREVVELAGRDREQAQARLGERSALIAGTLDDRLRDRLRDEAPDEDAQPWEDAVRQSVLQGEFQTATSLLGGGTGRIPEGERGPITVRPARWLWPWRDRPVRDVLAWYADRWTAPAEFAAYRPPDEDAAAGRLISALEAVVVRLDPASVGEFGAALADLLAATASDTIVATGDRPGYGVVLDFVEARVTAVEPFTRRMVLWFGDVVPPPAEVSRPMVWFHPVMTAEAASDPGLAVLDVSTMLRLVAPLGGRVPGDPATRRINLLRLLLPQLDPAAVLAAGPAGGDRDDLAWLLDVFGLTCDAAVLDVLRHDFGSSPAAFRGMVEGLILAARRSGTPGILGLEDLRRISVGLRSGIRDAVFGSLTGDVLARAALWLIIQLPVTDQIITAGTVLDEFRRQGLTSRASDWMINAGSVAAALATLAGHGLLTGSDDRESYRSPAPGLIAALRDPSGPSAAGRTQDLLTEIGRAVRDRHDAVAAVLGPRVTHLIGHRVDNEVIGIIGRLTRVMAGVTDPDVRTGLAEVQERIKSLGGGTYLDLYWSALAPPVEVEVSDLVGTLIGDVEWHLPAGVRIPRPTGVRCWVLANPTILEESIRNLILNAARALTRVPHRPALAAIQVSVGVVDESAPRPVPLTGPAVVIEVRDNGPGFSPGELANARRVTDPAGDSWHPAAARTGAGHGIPLTASMLREYRGVLEIRNSDDARPGSLVRAWLPRLTDPTAAGTRPPLPPPGRADHAPEG